MRTSQKIAIIIESIGVAFGASGIVVEIIYEADLGFLLITSGAMFFAAGSFLWSKIWRSL